MSGDDLRVKEAQSRLTAALDTLAQASQGPDRARAVAAYLAAQGIRGLRGNPMRCPVANYLRRYLPPEFRAGLAVAWNHVDCPQMGFYPGLPAAVREFIDLFDSGAFPELEEGTVQ